MNERQLQFRVGLLALVSMGVAAWLVFQFGELRELWEPTYHIEAIFDRAPGVFAGTPVRTNGVKIGSVKDVQLDERGVRLLLEIEQDHVVWSDAEISLSRGLLGDSSINVLPGQSGEPATLETAIVAKPYIDPMETMTRMETNVSRTLASFQSTSDEWQKVGHNLNSLLETNRGQLDVVVERTADSLHEFTMAMRSFTESANQANAIIGDAKNQENLRRTLESVPIMVEDTRAVIGAVRMAVQKADENLANLAEATGPLAERSASIAHRLDTTLANLESLSGELNEFVQLASHENGTLKAIVSDPSLYRNLDQSAESLNVLLTNLGPVLRDLRVFSDKIARHPEVMGLGGAISPSDGTKAVTPVGFDQPAGPGAARVRNGSR